MLPWYLLPVPAAVASVVSAFLPQRAKEEARSTAARVDANNLFFM